MTIVGGSFRPEAQVFIISYGIGSLISLWPAATWRGTGKMKMRNLCGTS